jgi:hypothetical protein
MSNPRAAVPRRLAACLPPGHDTRDGILQKLDKRMEFIALGWLG